MSRKNDWCFNGERPVKDIIDTINDIYSELNDEFENYDIDSIKKKFSKSTSKELNFRQINAFDALNERLEVIDKDKLSNLNPDYYFSEGSSWGDYAPNTILYDLKGVLLDFSDLLDWLLLSNNEKLIANDTLNTTQTLTKKKLTILNEIIESYFKFIFTTKLKNLAKKKSMTQLQIADALQTKQQIVSQWMNPNATTIPSVDKCVQLALLFETSVDFLVRPDCKELEIADDFISKECKLTATAIDRLRSLDKPHVIDTLNTIICNYRYDSDRDVLSAISDYMQMAFDTNLFVITKDTFNHIYDLLNESTSLENAKIDFKSYTKGFAADYWSRGAAYDASNALMLEINKKLTRLRDVPLKKYFG